MCAVIVYELVAAGRILVGDTSGDGEDLASVVLGKFGSNQASALGGAFYYDGCIGTACHDAVALYKVELVNWCGGGELGEKTALCEHLYGGGTVQGGVYLIQSVCKDGYCFQFVFQCGAVAVYINAVCQAADDDYIGAFLCEVAYEACYYVPAVSGNLARADYRENMSGIKVCCPAVEEYHWGIIAVAQSPGVSGVGIWYALYVSAFGPFHFLPASGNEAVHLLQALGKPLVAPGDYVLDVLAVIPYGSGTAHRVNEGLLLTQGQMGHPGQGHHKQGFVFVEAGHIDIELL